ncbi:Type IV pilus inner membrane component PilM [Gammaproteobacteria bacterium]
MWPFKKRWVPFVGIDISSSVIKLIELSRPDSGYRVESYAAVPLPSNAISERNIVDVEAVGEAIKKAVKRSGTRTKLASVAVSGSAVITKTISLSANLSEDEMEAQIQVEADQYIPFPLEEVYLDFQRLKPSLKNPEMVDVLLVASRRENIDLRVNAIEQGGLTARVVDIEAYAMEKAFSLVVDQVPDEGNHKTVAMIDVGATMTTLNVLYDQHIIYNREQVFGGRQLTERIQRHYGVSYEEAGEAKRKGGLPDDYGPAVLSPFREEMAQQVSRSLQFFFSSTQYDKVDIILLSGGTVSIPDAAQIIEARTGAPTVIANPFANMSLASRVNAQALFSDASSLMIACGLTLRSFD